MSSIADRAPISWNLLLAVVAVNAALALLNVRHAFLTAEEETGGAAPTAAASSRAPATIAAAPATSEVKPTAPFEGSLAGGAAAPVEQVALRKSAPVCHAWGPFADLGEAEALAEHLELAGSDFEVFQSEVEAAPDYLVTVRAPASREAADRILRELKTRNLDSYVLERGPQGNVLAVGVFRLPGGAERRQRQLAGLGYEADIEPLQRSHRVYHLLARVPAEQALEVAPAGGCGDIAPMQRFL